MDTLHAEGEFSGPVLVAIYSIDAVAAVSLPYIRPTFVPDYRNDTAFIVEGHGLRLIPPIRSASYPKDNDVEGDDDHTPPLPQLRAQPAALSASQTTPTPRSGAGLTTHPAIIGSIAVPPPAADEPFDRESAIACMLAYFEANRAKKPSCKRTFEAFKLLYGFTGKNLGQVSKLVNHPSSNCWTVLKQFEQLMHLHPDGWRLYTLAEQAGVKLSLEWLRLTAQLAHDMQISEIRGKARKHSIRL